MALLAKNRMTFRFTEAQKKRYQSNPSYYLDAIRKLLDAPLPVENGGASQ